KPALAGNGLRTRGDYRKATGGCRCAIQLRCFPRCVLRNSFRQSGEQSRSADSAGRPKGWAVLSQFKPYARRSRPGEQHCGGDERRDGCGVIAVQADAYGKAGSGRAACLRSGTRSEQSADRDFRICGLADGKSGCAGDRPEGLTSYLAGGTTNQTDCAEPAQLCAPDAASTQTDSVESNSETNITATSLRSAEPRRLRHRESSRPSALYHRRFAPAAAGLPEHT